MLTTSLLWMLISNNRYLFNYFMLTVIFTVYHAGVSLSVLNESKLLFNSHIGYDSLTLTIIVIGGLVLIWLMSLYSEVITTNKFNFNNEILALLLLIMVGFIGLSSTNSYLSLFVAIELQSLVLYIFLATNLVPALLSNTSKVSLSYLINAAMATALLLFGISSNSSVLVLVAVLWKLGVVPVHVWSLPILDNQHNIIVSSYLTLAKYGILVVIGIVASSSSIATSLLVYVGILNLTIGNILGLLQFRYQRIIVYSSLIQIGYILLVLGTQSGLGITYFEIYSLYTIMLLTLWILPTYNTLHSSNLMSNAQLWIMVLVLYTVAGLPFMPLFWTKLDILLAINSQSVSIALISTLLSSLIYIRLIKYISFFNK